VTPLLAKRLGTDRSFERLYRRHVADVYRYSLAMLRNPADAEDVTQTTFMNAYGAYRRGERPRAAQRWLITIAHNVCRQRFRQSQRRVEEVAFDETAAEAAVPDSAVPSVEELSRALGHLAFNQRAALVMRELEGRSYAEIAEVLGVTASAVETLVFRARRALREQLEGQLSCLDAEVAVSRQLDGRLPRAERGALRAHLRECKECASLARRLRAQRSAIKAFGLVPLPASLGSFFGGGAAAAGGGGVAMKAAAFVAASAVVAGAGHEVSVHSPFKDQSEPKAAAPRAAADDAVVRSADVGAAARRAEPVAARTVSARAGRGLVKPRPGKTRPATAAAKPERGGKLAPGGLSKTRPARAATPKPKAAKPLTTPRAEPKTFKAKPLPARPAKAKAKAKPKTQKKPAGKKK
jgi:RNA polymerase sigma factor (sigma-70 family)